MTQANPSEVAPARQRDTRQQRGWYFYDWANSSFPTTVGTVFFGPYLIEVAKASAAPDGTVQLFGFATAPQQLFFLALALSALLQILALPIVGAFADRSEHKRRWLAGTAYTGAGLTMAMFLVVPGRWQLGFALILLANLAFSASIVVYDSFLPEIADADDRDRVSSRGWAVGYVGGGLLLLINLIIYTFEPFGLSGILAVRISLGSAGLWWALFTIIPLRALEDGPALRDGTPGTNAVTGAFRELGRTMRELRGYPETLRYLVAFLLFNGGVGTVVYAAGSYATEELEIDLTTLTAAILMVQFVAFFGALALGRLAERSGAKTVVLWSLGLWSAVVIYGRFVPAGNVPVFFALAAAIGFVLGGTQALSRSLFSHLVPKRREAEFFGFYQISDRGTSVIGQLGFVAAYGVFGSYRQALLVLIVFFLSGGLLLAMTDFRKGIDAVGNEQPRVL
jgi:UMF1 family MFS transporter